MKKILLKHPLLRTLIELRGNPRACVLTEPMFGVPYNLYMPFMSVYMLALGVTDRGIGTLASLGLLSQLVATWLSGAIVDKFGRRVTVLVADIISFGVACLIWAAAQNAVYFVVAALINGLWRIAHTAWTCLMIEDAEEHHLVHIWTWISLFGMSASFLTPIGGWVVNRFGLVPAMRGLLLFGFVMLTAKCAVLYVLSHETERGVQRRMETRDQSLLSLLSGYRQVVGPLLRSRRIRGALALMTVTVALLAFFEFDQLLRKGTSETVLKLPNSFLRRTHDLIRRTVKAKYALLLAAPVAALVTLIEFGCTGQVYLPTITYVAGLPGQQMKVLPVLLVYNIAFILPLLAVILGHRFAAARFEKPRAPVPLKWVRLAEGILLGAIGAFMLWATYHAWHVG